MSKFGPLKLLMLSTCLLTFTATDILNATATDEAPIKLGKRRRGSDDDTVITAGAGIGRPGATVAKRSKAEDWSLLKPSTWFGSAAPVVETALDLQAVKQKMAAKAVFTQLTAAEALLESSGDSYNDDLEKVAIQNIEGIFTLNLGSPAARIQILTWLNDQHISDKNRQVIRQKVLTNPILCKYFLDSTTIDSNHVMHGYLNALRETNDEMLSLLNSQTESVAPSAKKACTIIAEIDGQDSDMRFKAGSYLLDFQHEDAESIMKRVFTSSIDFAQRFAKLNEYFDNTTPVFSKVARQACFDLASSNETFEDRHAAAKLPIAKLTETGWEDTFQANLSILFDSNVTLDNRRIVAQYLKGNVEMDEVQYSSVAIRNYINSLRNDPSQDKTNVDFMFQVFNSRILLEAITAGWNSWDLPANTSLNLFQALITRFHGQISFAASWNRAEPASTVPAITDGSAN